MPPALQNPIALWFVLTAALAVACYFGMRAELRLRAVLYGSFLIACLVAIWPPYGKDGQPGKIRLGLDLRGGIHLVLQVVTDEALAATIDDAVQTVREQATRKGIAFGSVQRVDATSFSLEGVEPARVKDARDHPAGLLPRGLGDPRAERGTLPGQDERTCSSARSRSARSRRRSRPWSGASTSWGWPSPSSPSTANTGDQILVQLPGVTDPEQAKRVIKTTAQLALKLVEDASNSRDALLQATGGKVPDDMEVVQGQGDTPGQPVFYLVRKEAVITGRDLKNARAGRGPEQRPRRAVHAEPAGGRQVQARDRAQRGQAGWPSSWTARWPPPPPSSPRSGPRA